MVKAAIIVLADTNGYEALGRVANALYAVKEFRDAGDEVRLIFDGAGVKWIGELAKADHMYHDLYEEVRDRISGVCEYCAKAFKVTDQITEQGLDFANKNEGHPSFRELMRTGYQPITF